MHTVVSFRWIVITESRLASCADEERVGIWKWLVQMAKHNVPLHSAYISLEETVVVVATSLALMTGGQ
jgi:hypothetical protein